MMTTIIQNVNVGIPPFLGSIAGTITQQGNQINQPTIDPVTTPQYWIGASGVILSIAVLLRVLLPVMIRKK
jgi:hypothetical protein